MSDVFKIFDYVADGICIIDSSYTVLFWNTALERMLGLPGSSIIKGNIMDFFPGIGTAPVKTRLDQLFENGLPVIFSNQLQGNLFEPVNSNPAFKLVEHIVVTGMPSINGKGYYGVFNVKDISELSKKISDYSKARIKALREIETRKKTERELKTALTDKDFLLREVHHRVKNNLALIGSIIELQQMETENTAARSILVDLNSRIRSISLIHEKLYNSVDVKFIDIGEYLTTIVTEIINSMTYKSTRIRIEYNIDKLSVIPKTAIAIGLLTTEIVTNSLKYGIRQGQNGKITLTLSVLEKKYILFKISDNGSGFPENFNAEDADSLGFKIIKSLALQLKAEHRIINKGGAVHRFKFRLQDNTNGYK